MSLLSVICFLLSEIFMKFFNTENQNKNQLKFIPLGGTTDVTKNMYVYEYGNDIIVVDAGIGFPDSDMLGVDVVIPDIDYLLQNREKVRGIIISHGHEDHFGALPYVLPELKVPVFATKLVQGFITSKLRERNITGVTQKTVETEKTVLQLGAFEVSFFHTNHSVPESQGIVIKTPAGIVMHVPDYKFDWTPVMGAPFDVPRALRLGEGRVLALISDCLGATNAGYTASEKDIEDTFHQIIEKNIGKQVIITTVSSNISRISQAIRSSLDHDRKIVLAGRSLSQNVEIAQRLGFLNFPPDVFVSEDKAQKMDQGRLTYLVAGAYGQVGSALWRIASDEHKYIKLDSEAAVVFSADPMPGVYDQVDAVINKLTYEGADVYYSQIQENLHVSGHGSQGDMLMLAGIAKPKYFVPIGGTARHMRAYSNLIEKMGVARDHIFELGEGQTLNMGNNQVTLGNFVETRSVFVDGSKVGEVGNVVIRDRQVLSEEGILVVSVPYATASRKFVERVQMVSRGFIYVKESQDLLNKANQVVLQVIRHFNPNTDFNTAKNEIERSLGHFLYKQTGRNPVVLVSIVEV